MKKSFLISMLFHGFLFVLIVIFINFLNIKKHKIIIPSVTSVSKLYVKTTQKTVNVSFYQKKSTKQNLLKRSFINKERQKLNTPKNTSQKLTKQKTYFPKKIILKANYQVKTQSNKAVIKKNTSIIYTNKINLKNQEHAIDKNNINNKEINKVKNYSSAKKIKSYSSKNNKIKEFNENEYIFKVKQKIERNKFYPPSATRRSIQGRVGLNLIIDKRGKIISVKVIHGSGSDILDNAALQSVYKAAPFGNAQKIISFEFGIKFILNENK